MNALSSFRDRLGAVLNGNKLVAGFELLIVPLLLALKMAGALRRSGWRQVGMVDCQHMILLLKKPHSH